MFIKLGVIHKKWKFAKKEHKRKTLELLKNIGLGIFVNGAYALQFTENTFEGFLGSLEGIITMLFAIYTPKVLKREKK
ncbi:MAG: hypothetical protein CGEMS_1433 [Candidatus Campylobacter infans]|nr:MAG: hypothetical protein CGEMS_1433 [Candidatus Campylobacter infans]